MSKNIEFNTPITSLVKNRISVRTYDEKKEITDEVIDKLNQYIENLNGPFNRKVRFKIIKTNESPFKRGLGTYGVIKGANTYIGVVVEKGPMALESLGYEMEELILYATELGLGTCWMGGTFNKSGFAKAMEVKKNEIFTIISPIGYKSEESRFIDKIFRKGNGDRRKDWFDLFYINDFYTPLDKDADLGRIGEALENVRLAPSALNKQPWRIILEGKNIHFFKVGKKSQSEKDSHIDLSEVDMGIALAHFNLTCKEFGINGQFKREVVKIDGVPKNVEYIVTWERE